MHREIIFNHKQYADNVFLILSGPSAGGKTTLSKKLGLSDDFTLLIKHTDRPLRQSEADTIDYFFLSSNTFADAIAESNSIVWVERYSHHYALVTSEIERALADQKIPLFILDPSAAIEFRRIYPNSILVFVGPDDTAVVYDRIMQRADLLQEKLSRIAHLEEEYGLRKQFDIIYDNTNEEELYRQIAKLIEERKGSP